MRQALVREWPAPAVRGVRKAGAVAPGLLVALGIAALATELGRLVPIVGGPVFGIVLGAVFAAVIPGLRAPVLQAGYGVAAKPALQLSIVVLGTGLSLTQVVRVGGQSLPVLFGTLAVALLGAWLFGRLLGVHSDARTLIGVGTGICGASAIAATTAVIEAAEADIAYALGTVFTCNIAAVLVFPPIGHLLGMGSHAFGLWAGTAINDTSSVVAASYAYGGDAGANGLVVKLTRTLMIIPVVVVLAVRRASKRAGGALTLREIPWRKIVPLFLIGFLVAVTIDTIGLIPRSWHPALSMLGTFLITTALAGIGLSLRLSTVRKAGVRPLLLGALLWVSVVVASIGLQAVTGTL